MKDQVYVGKELILSPVNVWVRDIFCGEEGVMCLGGELQRERERGRVSEHALLELTLDAC